MDQFQSTCLREARRVLVAAESLRRYFNPRAYVRHDGAGSRGSPSSIFQSTCLREARLRGCWMISRSWYFNPRAYVRHDR